MSNLWKGWSTTEEAQLAAAFANGNSYRIIAKILDRSVRSVKDRSYRLRLNPKKVRPVYVPRQVRIMISRENVLEVYELGWRVVGFDNEFCHFEWRSSGEPRWPRRGI